MSCRIACPVAALALVAGTTVVLWSGLNLPPPLWLVEYGLPSSQGPTGRVAEVEGIEFVEISRGYFLMGSDFLAKPGDAVGRIAVRVGLSLGTPSVPSAEQPRHWVEFPRGFWFARRVVSNAHFERFTPAHPRGRYGGGEGRAEDGDPVAWVSFAEAEGYGARLAGESGLPLRLPSEAEWECASRAGSAAEAPPWRRGTVLRWSGLPGGPTTANGWGILDLIGCVSQWCGDSFLPDYLGAPGDGSARLESDHTLSRVVRGGRWVERADLRPERRFADAPGAKGGELGFRLAFTLGAGQEHLVDPYLVD